jgi:hypothetical protein
VRQHQRTVQLGLRDELLLCGQLLAPQSAHPVAAVAICLLLLAAAAAQRCAGRRGLHTARKVQEQVGQSAENVAATAAQWSKCEASDLCRAQAQVPGR